MNTTIFDSKEVMGASAAVAGAQRLENALMETGTAAMIVATGASQFEMLASLSRAELDWTSIIGFISTNTLACRSSTRLPFGNTCESDLWKNFPYL